MAEPSFSKRDVKIVCQAVVDRAIQLDERGRNAFLYCDYCTASIYSNQDPASIEHVHDCPYLVAKDLLTGL